jgi:hypothetical protein
MHTSSGPIDTETTLALPFPPTVIDTDGEHVIGDFTIRVEELDTRSMFGRSRMRPPIRWNIVSALGHAAVLAIAFYFASHLDPKARDADNMTRMREYLSRISEQPRDPMSGIESTAIENEETEERAGTSGDGAAIDTQIPVAKVEAPKTKTAASTKVHRASRGGGGSGHSEGGSSCAAFAKAHDAAHHDPNATWIEFVLTDEDKHPVVGEPYRVTLPDGTVREGKTDARGLVCFTGVKEGNAHIEWPRLGNAARYMGPQDDPI